MESADASSGSEDTFDASGLIKQIHQPVVFDLAPMKVCDSVLDNSEELHCNMHCLL
jgi:hypothetical protein